jgi:hypothetical protein
MNNTTNPSYSSSEISLPRSIRFWLLLLSEIPSLACSLFILVHLLVDSVLRHSLSNHSIIALNIVALVFKAIDVPLYLNFIRMGNVVPSTPAHCLIWWFVDLGFYYTCSLIVAWASIERHILVFHHECSLTQRGRLFVHHLPLITLILYAISYYTWVIFFPPCDNIYDYTLPVCAAFPCYLDDPVLRVWEIGFHGCGLTFIIIIFSIGLIIRVVNKRISFRPTMQWRKHRKMTLQLVSITSVFIIFNLPINLMYIARMLGLPADVGVDLQLNFFFITYWLLFLLPFVCLNSLPSLQEKVRRMFGLSRRRQTNVVAFLPLHR